MKSAIRHTDQLATASCALMVSSVVVAAPAHNQEAADQADRQLETALVQSTKRDTTLQDAPISIGVVTDETIDDYTVADLSILEHRKRSDTPCILDDQLRRLRLEASLHDWPVPKDQAVGA